MNIKIYNRIKTSGRIQKEIDMAEFLDNLSFITKMEYSGYQDKK
jgi:hypothetical protein